MFLHKAMRYYRLWIYTCNLALLLSVMVFVVLAAWILSDYHMALFPTIQFHHPTFIYAYLALVLQGGVLQAIGCIGALRMNEKLLNIYWGLMLGLLLGDVIVGLVWLLRYNFITTTLRQDLLTRFQRDYGADRQFELIWNRVQIDSKCCGVNSPLDYNGTEWMRQKNSSDSWEQRYYRSKEVIPSSCCKMQYSPGYDDNVLVNRSCMDDYSGSYIHTDGCYDTVIRWLQQSADLLSVLGFCVIAFLKLCFLGILRYEIREMIQKIKILTELNEHSPLASFEPRLSFTAKGDGTQTLLIDKRLSLDSHFKDLIKNSNGNNNDADYDECKKKPSPV